MSDISVSPSARQKRKGLALNAEEQILELQRANEYLKTESIELKQAVERLRKPCSRVRLNIGISWRMRAVSFWKLTTAAMYYS